MPGNQWNLRCMGLGGGGDTIVCKDLSGTLKKRSATINRLIVFKAINMKGCLQIVCHTACWSVHSTEIRRAEFSVDLASCV